MASVLDMGDLVWVMVAVGVLCPVCPVKIHMDTMGVVIKVWVMEVRSSHLSVNSPIIYGFHLSLT